MSGRQVDTRVSFNSSHARADYAGGTLRVAIQIEDGALGLSTWDEVEFSVPPDFHAHNDAVAAALMTLVGREYRRVTFNFPISPACAATLRNYYGTAEIGPVDPSAAARLPGRRLGVNFSGGLDSLTVWLLMRELYGDDFAVVTSEYGGFYTFEARGYGAYQRDVSCQTDIRRKRYDRVGRFHFCVPLLFAEYLDLGAIVTGHCIDHSPNGMDNYTEGTQPAFLHGDLVVNAAGVADIHLVRSLTPVGAAKVIMALGPDRIERALSASSPPLGYKPYLGVLIFRHLHQDAGLPVPAFLRDYPASTRKMTLQGQILRLLYILKRGDVEDVYHVCPEAAQVDLSIFAGLSLDFFERYNPRIAGLLSEPLRTRAIEVFHACGIEPYDAGDWDELRVVRRFLKTHVKRYRNLVE